MANPKYGDIEFERRVFPRFVIHLPFTYEVDKKKGSGMTTNASRGGLQVYLSERMAEGDVLSIKLTLPDDKALQFINATARVVWIQKSTLPSPKNYKVGLAFVEITEKAMEFLQWFERLWLNQAS